MTGYFAHPVRGSSGDHASDMDILENLAMAHQFGSQLRQKFPDVEWYMPYEHEEIIQKLWRRGLSAQSIIEASIDICLEKDVAVFWNGNGESNGMNQEFDAREFNSMPSVWITDLDEEGEKIAEMIFKAKE